MNTSLNQIIITVGAITALAGAVPHDARAALVASDNAGNAVYNDGWNSGDNGGTGWGGGWFFQNARNGTFSLGDSSANGNGDTTAPFGDINTAGRAWGIDSGHPVGFTLAGRDLSGTLDIGQKIIFDFDNGFVTGRNSLFSVDLRNATASLGYYESLWGFSARGNNTNTYVIQGSEIQVVASPAFTDEGLHLEFTLTSATTYSVEIGALGAAPTTYTGSLRVNSTGDRMIRSFSFHGFNYDNTEAKGNISAFNPAAEIGYVNSIQVVPEPSTGLFVVAGLIGYLFCRIRKQGNAS